MSERVKQNVRYWGFLMVKLAVIAAITLPLLAGLNYISMLWYVPRLTGPDNGLFAYNLLYTSLAGVWFLLTVALVYLAVLDQRYRCRVCLRRLRMPVERGSWSQMLQLGRPQVEYICIYGHGKLNVSELQISGIENPRWQEQGDIWAELFAGDRDSKR